MKPVIGITSQFENVVNTRLINLNSTYVDAIAKAGGVPLVIPITTNLDILDSYLDVVDGLIFSGGGDISPLLFGEEPIKGIGKICLDRDKFELELFKLAYEKGTPILGICRGLQVGNIALGGTLYQDIYSQLEGVLEHVCSHNVHQGFHSIKVEQESILFDIFKKDKLVINSQHHQSIKDLGQDLKVIARASDKIIEAVESTNENFFLGLQFHPEAMIKYDDEFIKIFDYFIGKCMEEVSYI